jgi:hypothetical protein
MAKRQIYCGAYHFTALAVRKLSTMEVLNTLFDVAEVNHLIEHGEIAHTELRFIFKPGITDEEGAKTAIVDQLWRACSGPLESVCECDRTIANRPRANLARGELGLYMDSRSRWAILNIEYDSTHANG